MLACTVVEYGTWKSTLIWKLLRRLDLHLDTKIIVAGNRKRRINIWRLIAIETTALCLNEARFKATKVNNLGCKASNNTSSIFIHLFVCIYDTVREYSEVAIYLNFNFPGVVCCVCVVLKVTEIVEYLENVHFYFYISFLLWIESKWKRLMRNKVEGAIVL